MEQAANHTQYYQDVLHELINLGTRLAQKLEADPDPKSDPIIAYERIAKTIRRTIALARDLEKPVRARRSFDRTAARKKIIRGVENEIGLDIKGPESESFREELLDRLDAPEFEHDLETLTADQIIKQICFDIGLPGISGAKPWKRRPPEQIRLIHARAAAPPGKIRSPTPSPARGRGSG